MLNLSMLLENSARSTPNKKALIFEKSYINFIDLNNRANQVANALKDNSIDKGDRIGIISPNLPYFPIIYYGILKAGGIVVPMSIMLKANEIAYFIKDAGLKIIFVYEGSPELPILKETLGALKKTNNNTQLVIIKNKENLEDYQQDGVSFESFIDKNIYFDTVNTESNDPAVIIYTSGTTGRSKGAILTHSNLAWNADVGRHSFKFNQDDIVLTALPMFHIFGQTCLMNTAIMEGISNVLIEKFEPDEVLNQIGINKVTIFAGVPTMFWAFCNTGFKESFISKQQNEKKWRLAISGGAALPVELLKNFEKDFNIPIFEGYGMSEGSPMVTFNLPGYKRKVGSIGFPVWGVEVKVVDQQDNSLPKGEIGQLLYKGHNVMKGYFNNPEATKEALKGGWMHSGDMGYEDEDGYFYIVDRIKDMIIRGGYNVYPRELEEVMITHPSISLVAVIGVPDDRLGEEIKAFVIKSSVIELSKAELLVWVRERIANHKYPRIIEFVEELPLSATGKILKRELR
tara:strand:+ start:245 stop:1789 length:1545 start_codon:yes stop_codon:yes gene_type:complete